MLQVPAAFLVVFIGIWEVVFLLGVFPIVSLPSPLMVAQSLVDLIAEGTLIYSTAVTLLRLFVGFSTSIIIGVGVGLAMVKFPQFGKTMNSFAVGLQSFPSIAWVPFAILLIGLNDSGILFVVIMSSVFSIMISTYSGIRNIPPIYIRSARNMGAKGISLFRHVMLPARHPFTYSRDTPGLVVCVARIGRCRDVDHNVGRIGLHSFSR